MKIFILILIIFSPFLTIFSQTSFSTSWKTDNPGPSDNYTILIPLAPESLYDFEVNWGDGNNDSYVGIGSELTPSHTYVNSGIYSVNISGVFPRIFFNSSGDRQKLMDIEAWGEITWESFESAFQGCVNLEISATDAPNLSNVISLRRMFSNAFTFNQSIENWDVSNVSDMRAMFNGATSFNQPIDSWNVSNVTAMSDMFYNAINYNQPLNSWDVSNVTTMSSMFYNAANFNQPLNSWNVSNVNNMRYMFYQATSFNMPIDNWDVSSVTDMSNMFQGATNFNQPLNSWNVSNVTNMRSMFTFTETFNMPLNDWDVSSVTDMTAMFQYSSSFNGDISGWNVSNVTIMNQMFQQATAFNQNINSWDVSNVTQMTSMFSNATSFNQPLDDWDISSIEGNLSIIQLFAYAESFNQPLNSWDVSHITNMRNMFRGALAFNQPLDNWDMSSVSNVERMFEGASSFNQSLGSWDLSECFFMTHMLSNSGMNYCNYDQTLIGWANQTFPGQTLGATGLKYSPIGAPARAALVNFGWLITGDELIIPDDLIGSALIEGTEISITATGGTGNYTYLWYGPNEFQSTDSSIVAPQNGTYTVIVSDGCNQWTETFEILTVGISHLEADSFQLFPNPTTGLIYGFSNISEYNKIQVFDLNGKQVFESDFTSNVISFDLSHLQPGFYLGRLMDKNGLAQGVQRICVMR